jgi:hypothetical protein
MAQQEFKIFVNSNSSTPVEWKRAMEAPASALPTLSNDQKEAASKFGISEEEYARGVLAGEYGKARLEQRGIRLGQLAADSLKGLGPTYRLVAVIFEGAKMRWVFRIQTPQEIRNLSVSEELTEDVLDSELFQSIQEFRQQILNGIGAVVAG